VGLGLFLARSIAERLGGSLRFESEVGRGTTVRLGLSFDPSSDSFTGG
jgi:signal transduction histidine kinase